MPIEVASNGGSSSLSAAITAAATVVPIQAADVGHFLNPAAGSQFHIAVTDGTNTELMTVTGGFGTANLTVTRASEAYNGTQQAYAFAQGATVNHVLTVQALQGLDAGRWNHLINAGFEIGQRVNATPGTSYSLATQNGYVADRWMGSCDANVASTTWGYGMAHSGQTVWPVRPAANPAGSAFCAVLSNYGGNGVGSVRVQQKLENVIQYQGQQLSLSVVVWAAAPNTARIALSDGVTTAYSAYHPGDSQWHLLTVTLACAANASAITVTCTHDLPAANSSVYFDNCMLVFGSAPAAYQPLAVPDEFMRCLRYYEKLGDDGGADLMFRHYAGVAGQAGGFTLLFRSIKAVQPSVTQVGTWTTGNASATLTIAAAGKSSAWIQTAALAIGDAYVYSGGTGANLVVEANP